MQIQVVTQFTNTIPLVVVSLYQNDSLKNNLARIASEHGLSETILGQEFKADTNEMMVCFNAQNQKIVLLGLGQNPVSAAIIRAFRTLFAQQKLKLPTHVGLDIRLTPAIAEFAMNGIILGGYHLGVYKTETKGKSKFYHKDSLLEVVGEGVKLEQLKKGKTTAKTQIRVLDLMNAPANKKTPEVLANWALASGHEYGYSVEVLDLKQIQKVGLGGLLAINKGSEHEPRFIVVQYRSEAAKACIGLVGKGVTFDTGGISIKSANNMHLMKSDMGGAAAVLGAVELVAKLKLPVHLIGIIPATENSVDGHSTKPSDVIHTYSGKTIEMIDTDAEGRVILADGLGFMVQNFKPDVLIDLATLTGSCVATLGYHAAGMFTNNDTLAQQITQAADATGERVWRLPLWDIYKEDIGSDIADVRNFSGKPMAGAISAAKFLEVFTENHSAWAHLDIAGTAFGDTDFAPQRMGTAYGVRLLTKFIEEYTAVH